MHLRPDPLGYCASTPLITSGRRRRRVGRFARQYICFAFTPKLIGVETVVMTALPQQFFVSAGLLDFPLGDDENSIRPTDGAEAMGDHETDAPCEHRFQTALDELFGFGVDG